MVLHQVHTTSDPRKSYGSYPDPVLAEHIRDHVAAVLHLELVVEPVEQERSFADLLDSDEVFVRHAAEQTVAHRDGRSGTAPCGAAVFATPITFGHARVLCARPCPGCWGGGPR